MSRFQIGEKVFVRRAVKARHCNSEATVVAIEISQHSRPGVTSLDKYIVRFSDDETAEFYDIHLDTVQPSEDKIFPIPTQEPV